MHKFSENLKRIRTLKNITQEELAKKINIHPVQFSRYERGLTTPSIDIAQNIAFVLDVTLDELVVGNENEILEKNIKDQELMSLFKRIQSFGEQQKNTVKELISAFILKNELKQKLV